MIGTARQSRARLALAVAAAMVAAGPAAAADPTRPHGSAGAPGAKAKAARTVAITLRDNLFEPESIDVKKGETIRFVLKNTGDLLHEFNIGTPAAHAAHQKEMAMLVEHGMLTATGINHEMMKMDHSKMGLPAMKHDAPNTVLIEPGKTAELVWTFAEQATLEYACNLPGYYDAGMVGRINVRN